MANHPDIIVHVKPLGHFSSLSQHMAHQADDPK
jgi:hypothetical protein